MYKCTKWTKYAKVQMNQIYKCAIHTNVQSMQKYKCTKYTNVHILIHAYRKVCMVYMAPWPISYFVLTYKRFYTFCLETGNNLNHYTYSS